MPYIAAADRPAYDALIDRLAAELRRQDHAKRKGHANYVITRLLRGAFGVDSPEGESYSSYADLIGTLEAAKLETYRRWVAAYEDRAIARHGDV
jgi:hypothetical protein